MKQLLQNLRTGEFTIADLPRPERPPGFVLVATRASLISAGTERATVKAAQASLLGKARQRPDKVRQVVENIRREGLLATYRKVREKLDQPKALGYSSAGVVLEVDPGEAELSAGDAVACGGGDYAVHAEVVAVPRNLVVPLPEGLGFEQGAFGTIGAIALQGVRRAEAQLGDRVLVIGLGLIGQLTWQLLTEAGCRVIGTDISAEAVRRAADLGLETALVRGKDDVEAACAELTGGHGVDAVIITAAAKSRDPLELAGAAARERGRVVVVGAVPMDVPREPFYMKELDLRVSRSYGPGRYDPAYEEAGQDYPYGFVRWTEGRNIAAFLEAVARGAVKLEPLITHRFPLEDAISAYEIVSGKRREPHVAILLQYAEQPEVSQRVTVAERPKRAVAGKSVRLACAGAGSFARAYLLPHLQRAEGVELVAVATAHGHTAADAAAKFGFGEARTDAGALVCEAGIDAVVIATRHDRHAPLAAAALRAGKHVFCEKPLALDEEQLADVLDAAREAPGILQVGFNRRFSPLSAAIKRALAGARQPAQITYRVNAGPLPKDHWILDPVQGGGRIIGEGCHFIDLMQFFTGSEPVRVHAAGFGEEHEGAATVTVAFADGSVGVLVYQANASRRVPKERVEVFAGGRGGIIEHWRRAIVFEGARQRVVKARGQSKGYAEEIAAFLASVRTGTPALPLQSAALTTAATFAAVRSIAERQAVDVTLPSPPA